MALVACGAVFAASAPDPAHARKARPATGRRILEGGAYNKLLHGQLGAYSFRRTRLPHVATCLWFPVHMPELPEPRPELPTDDSLAGGPFR